MTHCSTTVSPLALACSMRLYASPPATWPFSTRLLSEAPWRDCATTKSAFLGLTVVSLSPWKTMAGTTSGFDPAGPVRARLGAGPPLPCIAANAEGMSRAAPQASPECTPIAAYRSLNGIFVLAQTLLNHLPEEVIVRPGQIFYLNHKLRSNPMHAAQRERR